MTEKKIPIILLQGENLELNTKLLKEKNIRLVSIFDISDIDKVPTPTTAVPDFLTVINIDGVDKRKVVIGAMILRNAGHQVFLTSSIDYNDLLTLLADVYDPISVMEDKTSLFRTEILITEVAIRVLGDISLIVKEFENNLRKSD
jgi:hypothetical protein